MQTLLVCLCLLSMALSIPVPPPLPGRAAGNCVGQHRILLKGCNAKHGFYVFRYVYSVLTRRNQTQVKKEAANRQNTIPGHRLGEDNAKWGLTEDKASPEQGDTSSTDALENGTGLQHGNHSTQGAGGGSHSPHPGSGLQGRGGVGVAGPTPTSAEGSGDLDLVVEVNGGVATLPQEGRASKAMEGNGSGVGTENRDSGALAVTTGKERAHTTGDEGSGETTVPGQGQEDVIRGTWTGGANLASVSEKTENIQVDAKGVDEYTYIPDSSSVTVTHSKVGSTSFAQISPDKDDEVNIFIGRANIHVGEQETTQASTIGTEDDGIPTTETRLGSTVAHDSDDNDDIPVHRQPEGTATTTTLSHDGSTTSSHGDSTTSSHNESITRGRGDSITRGHDDSITRSYGDSITRGHDDSITRGHDKSIIRGHGHSITRDHDDSIIRGHGDSITRGHDKSITRGHGDSITRGPGDDRSTGKGEDGATNVGDGERPVAPSPWSVTDGDIIVPVRPVNRGNSDDEVRGEGQRFEGKLDLPAVTTSRQGHDEIVAATVPAKGASIRLSTTLSSPRASKGNGTTALGTAGTAGSGEARPAPSQPRGEGRPGAGARVHPGLGGPDETPRVDKAAPPRGKAGSWAASGARARTGGGLGASGAGGSPPPLSGRSGGSVATGKGQQRGRDGEARGAAVGTGGGHPLGRYGGRTVVGAPGPFAALGRSRRVDQVRRADELHIRERAFYSLGGVGSGPHRPYAGPGVGSADSSQSSEGERGSRSDSRQAGLRTSGWGAPEYPRGHWSQGTL